MDINKINFEEICVDYFDGSLSQEEVERLMLFLTENPDLAEKFWDYDPELKLEANTEVFQAREKLIRGFITPENADFYLAAYVEGDLSAEEQIMIEEFANQHQWFSQQLILANRAKLQPDLKITFRNKKSLKKPVVLSIFKRVAIWTSAAAVFTALVVSNLMFLQHPVIDQASISVEKKGQPQGDFKITQVYENPSPLPSGTVLADYKTLQDSDSENVVVADGRQHDQLFTGFDKSTLFTKLGSRPAHVVNPYKDYKPEPVVQYTHTLLLNAAETRQSFIADLSPGEWVSSIGTNLAEDLDRIEERLSQNRPSSLLGLAGASLMGLNQILGLPLNMQSKRDESGQTWSLSIGRSFEISRTTP